jgi:hypothetical protein
MTQAFARIKMGDRYRNDPYMPAARSVGGPPSLASPRTPSGPSTGHPAPSYYEHMVNTITQQILHERLKTRRGARAGGARNSISRPPDSPMVGETIW